MDYKKGKKPTKNLKRDELPETSGLNRGGTFNFVHKDEKPTVVNNYQVIGATKTHIGDNYSHNNNYSCCQCAIKNGKNEADTREFQIKITKEMKRLESSFEPVEIKDINEFYMHVGNGWQNIFRVLGYTSGFIAQKEEHFSKRNLPFSELIHWLFKDWIESTPSASHTVGALATALLKSEQYDALTIWAQKYDEIHH